MRLEEGLRTITPFRQPITFRHSCKLSFSKKADESVDCARGNESGDWTSWNHVVSLDEKSLLEVGVYVLGGVDHRNARESRALRGVLECDHANRSERPASKTE